MPKYAKEVLRVAAISSLALSTTLLLSPVASAQGRLENRVKYFGKFYDSACLWSLSQRGSGLTDEEYEYEMDIYCAWTGVENPEFPKGDGIGTTKDCGSDIGCVRVTGFGS